MSVMKTADSNDVNPILYLEHLLRHADAVKNRPEKFLPWRMNEILAKSAS